MFALCKSSDRTEFLRTIDDDRCGMPRHLYSPKIPERTTVCQPSCPKYTVVNDPRGNLDKDHYYAAPIMSEIPIVSSTGKGVPS